MHRSGLKIALAAIGSLLLIALQGCAHRPAETPPPTAIAVKVDDKPPADLMVCPVAPEGFPLDQLAIMPPGVRAAAMRLASAYADVRSRLTRFIDWYAPAPCPQGDK